LDLFEDLTRAPDGETLLDQMRGDSTGVLNKLPVVVYTKKIITDYPTNRLIEKGAVALVEVANTQICKVAAMILGHLGFADCIPTARQR
jgi:hypothetical protein